IPEFFIKFLTDPNDLVVDPFAGSNVTGEVAERLRRYWLAFEIVEEYLEASKFRFPGLYDPSPPLNKSEEEKCKTSLQLNLLESRPQYKIKEDG
ncbi:TPA: site-specific DNA-methyltransferase, partial [Candidatus Poribacteria bacterium]|nr:site-specific DNA-methyltransferase [Candidatus Poribacteria bacterium]HEX28813.1 site-specific DNA-methyltransferase [Candidatus Poribacteria bacterium]